MLLILPVIFGLAPSFIWLCFYIRKDAHPESNKMVLKIFSFGMTMTIIAAILELGAQKTVESGTNFVQDSVFLSSVSFVLYNCLIIFLILLNAFIEEYIKYAVVKETVLNNSAFDEPTDAMIYMIIVGLGFAAVENMLILFSMENFFGMQTAYVWSLRFFGATLLHALCSGTVGYFLALRKND